MKHFSPSYDMEEGMRFLGMVEDLNGDYVLFSEANARIKELETENAQWKRVIVTHVDEIARLKQVIEDLEKCLPKEKNVHETYRSNTVD